MGWKKTAVEIRVEIDVATCDGCNTMAAPPSALLTTPEDVFRWYEASRARQFDQAPTGWASVRPEAGDPMFGPKATDGRHLCGKCWEQRVRRLGVAR